MSGRLGHAPLGEASAGLVVLGAALAQVVQALRHRLTVRAGQGHHTLVHLQQTPTRRGSGIDANSRKAYRAVAAHLDTGDDVLLLEELHERGAVSGLLVQGLLEQDHTADVLAQACNQAPSHAVW